MKKRRHLNGATSRANDCLLLIARRMPRRPTSLIIITLLLLCLIVWHTMSISNDTSAKEQKMNDMQVFELQSKQIKFSFLDPVNPQTDLKSIGFQALDAAHRNGLYHKGAWIHVMDTSLSIASSNSSRSRDKPRTLLLKRGNDLVTCPNTWSLLGEHTYRDEPPIETVKRAVLEELGSKYLHQLEKHGTIKAVTDQPVYYERAYGPTNGNRMDRQITYIWLVEMNFQKVSEKPQDVADEQLELDDEVADHTWIFIEDFERQVEKDEENGYERFCHDTIRALLHLGLTRIKTLVKD